MSRDLFQLFVTAASAIRSNGLRYFANQLGLFWLSSILPKMVCWRTTVLTQELANNSNKWFVSYKCKPCNELVMKWWGTCCLFPSVDKYGCFHPLYHAKLFPLYLRKMRIVDISTDMTSWFSQSQIFIHSPMVVNARSDCVYPRCGWFVTSDIQVRSLSYCQFFSMDFQGHVCSGCK